MRRSGRLQNFPQRFGDEPNIFYICIAVIGQHDIFDESVLLLSLLGNLVNFNWTGISKIFIIRIAVVCDSPHLTIRVWRFVYLSKAYQGPLIDKQ